MTIKEIRTVSEIATLAEKYLDTLSIYAPVSFDGDIYYEVSEPNESYDRDGTYTVKAIKEDEIYINTSSYEDLKRLDVLHVYYPVYTLVYNSENEIIDVRDKYDSIRYALNSQPWGYIIKTGEELYKWMNS